MLKMRYKTLDNFNFKGKRVLLRSDLNSEIKKGKIVMNPRISESAKTIKELMKKKARVVVIAHQGRKGKEDFGSLKEHAKLLNKIVKVKFIDDIIGAKAIDEIKKLKDGEVLLLDNVRLLDEEMNYTPNNKIVKTLAPLLDIYINDAFSVSHRAQTSIVGFPEVLPFGIGRLMQKELESLEKLQVKDALFVLGGSKPEEILLLLNNKRKILASGTFAILALMTKGYNFGEQGEKLEAEFKDFDKLKNRLNNVTLPVDFAVEINGERKNVSLNEFSVGYVKIADAENHMLKHVDECNLEHKRIADDGNSLCRKFLLGEIFLHPKVPNKPHTSVCGKIQGLFDLRRVSPATIAPPPIQEYSALDIGEETIKLYVNEIKKAKTIFMKGPAGKFEKKNFGKGTKEILKVIAASKAFSVIGGGHLTSALKKFKISEKKFDYISLSGGAFLAYLAGEKLPGLEAFGNSER